MENLYNWFGYGATKTPEIATNPTKSVLSLNGGGVRAIIPLYVLAETEKRVGKKAGDIFDFTAATSAGCLIHSALNLPSKENPLDRQYSADDLTRIMEPKIKRIFDQTYLNSFKTIDGYIAPKYSSLGLDSVVTELFNNTLAKDLLGNYCYIGFDTTDFNHSYFPFASRIIKNDPSLASLKVADMLHGVTAAPTYFSPREFQLHKKCNIVDGGLIANNPSLIAYTETKTIFKCGDNMTLFSIGTGAINYKLEKTDWGALHWASNILPAMFAGQDSSARSLTDQLLNVEGESKKFYSVQFDLENSHDGLDDTSDQNMEYLKDVAKTWIDSDEGDATLRELCLKLERPS